MELSEIVEVKETKSESEVNQLLDAGWIILSSGFSRGTVPGYDRHSYSLGLPKDVAATLEPKEYPDGVNF
jgi:hypothetical protein